jgi:hypothetical protein
VSETRNSKFHFGELGGFVSFKLQVYRINAKINNSPPKHALSSLGLASIGQAALLVQIEFGVDRAGGVVCAD